MTRGTTIFARVVVYLAGLAALAVCAILLPELAREETVGKPTNIYLIYAFLGGAYILSIPFFAALFQTHTLLHYIDKNYFFSNKSIKALQNIKLCAVVFSVMVIIAVISGLCVTKMTEPTEEVTFMVTFGFIFTCVSSVIAVFVAVLQKILADAVALKSENDLIV